MYPEQYFQFENPSWCHRKPCAWTSSFGTITWTLAGSYCAWKTIRISLTRENSNLEWTLDQLREAIITEIRVLEAGTFAPPSKLEDHPCHTAAFHTGLKWRVNSGNHWSVHSVKGHTKLHNMSLSLIMIDVWTLLNGTSCVSIALVTIKSVNVSRRAAVNIVRSDNILVCAEKHWTLKLRWMIALRNHLHGSHVLLLRLHRTHNQLEYVFWRHLFRRWEWTTIPHPWTFC